jgi:DNA repair protein RecN (Recombination protein N)
MLKHIAISQFAIVDSLELDLQDGMTVITGETGAGKSIMIDALSLCLGDRAEARVIRPGAEKAEVCATFSIDAVPAAKQWLIERELDAGDECLLRRVVSADGRSKAFINGSPSTLADCATLGALLVDIHSQHAHQSLLRKTTQRELLDHFAGAETLAAEVATLAEQWRTTHARLEALQSQSGDVQARRELLSYQSDELASLALEDGEIEQLEAEQKQLANARFLIESAAMATEGCETLADQLHSLRQQIDDERHSGTMVEAIRDMISSAAIQLDEARRELRHYGEGIDIDPERLQEITTRLEAIYDMARKHRVLPEQLLAHREAIDEELATLSGDDQDLDALRLDCERLESRYREKANQLRQEREQAGRRMAKKTETLLGQLAMSHCTLKWSLQPRSQQTPHPQGTEDVELLISTHPGATPAPLGKVASGGELSRVSLALHVVASDHTTTATMIFDEVDVGIGGAVAEVVGKLLRALSERVQVLCVTHLPQVAAKGQHHWQVEKTASKKSVVTALRPLDDGQRIDEIARMLGGITITDATRENAREMLGLPS